jgi:hypothetical protein
MSAPQRLRSTRELRSSPSSNGPSHIKLPAPHIFLPAQGEPARELERPFDFKGPPGYYNEAAKTALLRRAKQAPHDELLVDFSQPEVQIELRGSDVLLTSGPWTWQASAASQPLTSQGPWRKACWRREDQCDYLEIEQALTGGWKLRRQMLLVRKDRFLLLADALLRPAGEAEEIRYTHCFPLTATVEFRQQRETRDGSLVVDSRRRASLVPPALAEWRAEFCHAELSDSDGRVVLQQAALGRGIYAPLWIDLDPSRLHRPLTWRRLTVAENLAIVPRDVAAAYRIQAGRQQWIIYRSLAPARSRSVLGYNTLASFACLRLLSGAKAEEILEL